MTDSWKKDLRLAADVLHAWADFKLPPMSMPGGAGRADVIRSSYQMQFDPVYFAQTIGKYCEDYSDAQRAETLEIGGYISVEAVTVGKPTLFPILTMAIRVHRGSLALALRVVTFYDDPILECVDAHGWRFDMADPPQKPDEKPRPSHHSFPHVQRITSWAPSSTTFHPRGQKPQRGGFGENMSGPTLNESRPAFPLPVKSPAGILAAAMTSLYGGNVTSQILENVPQRPGAFRKEVAEIIGNG